MTAKVSFTNINGSSFLINWKGPSRPDTKAILKFRKEFISGEALFCKSCIRNKDSFFHNFNLEFSEYPNIFLTIFKSPNPIKCKILKFLYPGETLEMPNGEKLIVLKYIKDIGYLVKNDKKEIMINDLEDLIRLKLVSNLRYRRPRKNDLS